MNHSTVSASTASAQTFSIKKTALAGMLVALTVALSGFSIPIGASKCFPIQHLVNVLAGVFLGPVYGVSMAFCVSLIRNILGTGSLLAFPGSKNAYDKIYELSLRQQRTLKTEQYVKP